MTGQKHNLIVEKRRIRVQIMIEVEGIYQGITQEERMAICHIFDNKEEDLVITGQLSDAPSRGE